MENNVAADGRPPMGRPVNRLDRWLSYVNAGGGEAVACARAESSAGTSDGMYFYRPGAILIRHSDARTVGLDARTVGQVKQALAPRADVTAEQVVGESGPRPITRLDLDTSSRGRWTAPQLLADLPTGLRGLTSLDYVGFPAVLCPAPWVNGGPGGWPATVPNLKDDAPAVVAAAGRSRPLVVFDTGLLDVDQGGPEGRPEHPEVVRTWMSEVKGELEPQWGGSGSGQLDLFDSHGMFVAGVLACAAPGTPINVVRVYKDNGSVSDFELARRIECYLADPAHANVRLVNFSGGMYAPPSPFAKLATYPRAMRTVIEAHPNVLFVAAAGNGGGTRLVDQPFYPAAFGGSLANVIGVGATDAAGGVAPFSNHMPSAQVWAHGQNVVNAFKSGTVHLPGGGVVDVQNGLSGTAVWHGTSFAAPLVAGVLARYIEGLNGDAIEHGAPQEWLLEYCYGTKHRDGRLVVRADPAQPVTRQERRFLTDRWR